MALPIFIAVNQTALDITLDQLRLTVPGSGTVTLSDFNTAYLIQADTQLYNAVVNDEILLNDGFTTLTKPESLAYLTPTASLEILTNVESGADVTDWTNVSAALGGQAGVNSNFIFKSDGSGGGSMVKNTQVIPRRVTVGTAGDVDYTSIAVAVAAAISGGASSTVAWEVIVYPGTYTEPPITIQAGVTLYSQTNRLDTVYVIASNPLADLFTFTTGGSVSGLNCSGVTDPTKCIFRVPNPNTLAVLHGVSVKTCSNGLICSGGAKAVCTFFSVNITGPGENITGAAIKVTGAGSYVGLVSPFFSVPAALLPFYVANPVQTGIKVDAGSSLYVVGGTFRLAYKDSTADTICADDGSIATILSSELSGNNNALRIGSVGTATKIIDQACSFSTNVLDIKVESSTGKRFTSSTADTETKSLVAGATITGIVQNRNINNTKLIGNVEYQYPSEYLVDLAEFFHDNTSTGSSDGGIVTAGAGLTVDVTSGDGWIVRQAPDNDASEYNWAAATGLVLAASSTNYVYYDTVLAALTIGVVPTSSLQILLATAVTDLTSIRYLHNTRTIVNHAMGTIHDYLINTHKFNLKTGLSVSQGSTIRKLNVASGSYYVALNSITYPGSGGDATWSYFYGTNGATEVPTITLLDITNYDNAGTLTAMSAGFFRSDTVFITSDNRVSVVYGTTQYATQTLAEAAFVANVPTFIEPTGFSCARAIVQQGVGIAVIKDARPTYGSGAGGGAGGVSVHSALSGLAADDHTQYLLVSGSRAMSGALNMGGNAIGSVGTVDGVTVSAHAARHLPGGADALTMGTPVAVQVGAAPSDGSAATFARSDHQHGITSGSAATVGTANSAGSASSVSRSDHVHDHGAQTSGTLHAAVVPAGASGFMTGADKTKLDGITSGATNTPLTGAAPENVTKSAAVVGVSTNAARADHKHNIDTATAVNLGNANAEGTSSSLARADHVHAHTALRQLIHFVDNGPAEGFASLAYRETLPAGDPFPTSVTWWTSSAKLVRIVEKLITVGVNKFPTQIQWKVYSEVDVLLSTITDAFDYTGGNLLTPKITRTLV